MDELREQQVEALEVLCSYNERFLNSIHTIIPELEGNRKEDTDEFLAGIVKGINWEIGILNGTMALINEKEERIRKDEFNANIMQLSKALEGKNDEEIAKALKEALPLFEKLGEIAKETIS